MTYRTVLQQFRDELTTVKSYDCFTESEVDSTGQSSGNRGGSLLSSWISTFTTVENQIFAGLDCLFNDPYADYPIEDDNYQTINGYADASSAYDYFDEPNLEFVSKPEYFYARGNLYDMLPKANEGEYIYKYISNIIKVVNLCDEHQVLYDNFSYTPTTGSDGVETTSKAEEFWNEYYASFSTQVNTLLNPIKNIGPRFESLKPFIKEYKDIFYQASLKISKAESFIASINKTSTGKKTRLSDSYSNISSSGFSMYSPNLGTLYTLYKNSASKYESTGLNKTDYSYNNLRKIYYSDILVYYNFYSNAVDKYNWVLNFRKEFNI